MISKEDQSRFFHESRNYGEAFLRGTETLKKKINRDDKDVDEFIDILIENQEKSIQQLVQMKKTIKEEGRNV